MCYRATCLTFVTSVVCEVCVCGDADAWRALPPGRPPYLRWWFHVDSDDRVTERLDPFSSLFSASNQHTAHVVRCPRVSCITAGRRSARLARLLVLQVWLLSHEFSAPEFWLKPRHIAQGLRPISGLRSKSLGQLAARHFKETKKKKTTVTGRQRTEKKT